MDSGITYIARKLKELGGELAEASPDQRYKLLYHNFDQPSFWQKYLIHLMGQSLEAGNDSVKEDLHALANLLGKRSAGTAGSLDSTISLLYDTRAVIVRLLEQESKAGTISVHDLFDCIRILDPLNHTIVSSVIAHYNEILSITKFALEESAADLKMSLTELAELKKVLNEATIFAVIDEHDNYLYVNERLCEISKYTKEELIGKNPSILDSGYQSREFFQDVLEELNKGKVWNGQILAQAKDGSTYWVDTTLVPFLDSTGKRYKHISLQYDITEQKKTEETLLKAEKLSMVGELAAGFAHEIRNPLTTIKGFVQLLTETTKETVFTRTILDEIDRINSIVSDFMIFARPHSTDFRQSDLVGILHDAVKFLEPEATLRSVLLITHFPKKEVLINGEKNQLKQVFLNIIKNAIEAIVDGGIVSILLEEQEKQVAITITDTGVGMTEEQLAKLGEPFFTTKATGNGLGLMVTHKIIRDHRGTIEVQSEGPGKGSTFIITFPYRQ
ncbi:PAS domain-containing sensor histidine kinase [Bacillus sp. B-jedd]|uniref:PAS domain-containing sensor histidine kinase n=1 Tax=Bacillus sp. B-jedd TaxID=1476857 RepID=UPI00051571BF|nr:PAS domain-containing sensor histidine kinase [Bacillus sp. B-jedd]CEG29124.1 sporulation-specific ATP-dependent protein histidine kinase [Bacillus sp. B-jedd]